MNKYVKLFFLLMGLSIPVYSAEQVPTPTMSGDNPLLDYVGVSTCRIGEAQGTGAVFCSSSPVIVYGVSTSSVAATAYMTLYSTNSVLLVGATGKHVQFNDNNQADEDTTATQEYPWVRAVRFPLGLVIKASADPGEVAQQEWIVYYREVK